MIPLSHLEYMVSVARYADREVLSNIFHADAILGLIDALSDSDDPCVTAYTTLISQVRFLLLLRAGVKALFFVFVP